MPGPGASGGNDVGEFDGRRDAFAGVIHGRQDIETAVGNLGNADVDVAFAFGASRVLVINWNKVVLPLEETYECRSEHESTSLACNVSRARAWAFALTCPVLHGPSLSDEILAKVWRNLPQIRSLPIDILGSATYYQVENFGVKWTTTGCGGAPRPGSMKKADSNTRDLPEGTSRTSRVRMSSSESHG